MKSFWIMVSIASCLLLCSIRVEAQAEHPDVPLGHSAYIDIKTFTSGEEIFACNFGEPLRVPRTMTRYEFAVAIARRIMVTTGDSKQSSFFLFLTSPQFAALQRLLKEFRPELDVLGVPALTLTAQTNEDFKDKSELLSIEVSMRTQSPIAAPFKDVPREHWAFEAVEKLRQSGIVVGDASKTAKSSTQPK